MSKSNFLSQKFFEKTNIALVCILVMFLGFLISRVALSIATIAFGVNALRGVNPRLWLRNKWWLVGLLWLAVFTLSFFWSKDTHYWWRCMEVKLPFLLLPLSFSLIPVFTKKQLAIYTVCLGAMLLCGAVYSTSFLFRNMAFYYEQYRIAQVLPTPVGGDHIRFSLAIAFYIVWCVYFWPQASNIFLKYFIVLAVVLLTVYLHILAAKSGIIAIYIFYISFGIYFIVRRKFMLGITIIFLFVSGIYLAMNYIPTFSQRVGYISYTYIVYKSGEKSGDYGDIGRLISYDIATKIIKVNPLTGVGAGDMLDEMKKGYDKWYPNIPDKDRLLPHNQFLTNALGGGISAAILFSIWFCMPLFNMKKTRESFFFLVTWLILLFQLMIEPVLEVQYGVFVFLFFLLWQGRTLNDKSMVAIK